MQSREQTLRDALDRLAAAANVRLSYSAESLPLDRPTCASFTGVPLGEALRVLLAGLDVNPVLAAERHVVLAPSPARAAVAAVTPNTSTAVPLERVVVTGSAVGASQRHLPYALNEVSAERLATSSTGALPQLLNGSIPGMWAWAQTSSDLLVRFASVRGASSFGASYPKVYIDGIEVANPLVLSEINPESVGSIEVIRGPQGAALYGTDAISGVVNIVSRNDSVDLGAPRLSIRSGLGFGESDFTTSSALRQNHALTLRGGGGSRTGMLNMSLSTDGEFVPGAYSRQLSLSGSGRMVTRNAIATSTLRFHGERAAPGTSPLLPVEDEVTSPARQGTYRPVVPADSISAQSIFQYTAGTTVKWLPAGEWMHSVVVGIDGYRLTGAADDFRPVHPMLDQGLVGGGGADRATLRGSAVRSLPTPEGSTGTLTVTAEQSILREMVDAPRGGQAANGSNVLTRRVDWVQDWGVSGQADYAFADMVFLSGGLRLERNEGFTHGSSYALLPMLGAAFVTDSENLELKFRAAYGKGIRPPRVAMREVMWGTRGDPVIAADLDPEVQTGLEAGIDLTYDGIASLQVTRFDQLASGLIQSVAVGEAWFPAQNRRRVLYQLQNVGEITNRGWELQGSVDLGRVSLAANVATVNSRVRQLAFGYTGDLRPGDRMLEVPARTGGLTASWSSKFLYASVSASRAWSWINYDRLALVNDFASADERRPALTGAELRSYWREYEGSNRLDANLRFPVRPGMDLIFSAENLLNAQLGEPDNLTIIPGRTLSLGAAARF